VLEPGCIYIENEYGKIAYYENDEEMVKQKEHNLFFEQEYVISYLKDFILKSKVILDIGAHCGSHSMIYKSLNSKCKIYAFEPQTMLYRLLVRNLRSNGYKSVLCLNNAVGNKIGAVEMNSFSTDGLNSYENVSYGGQDMYNLAGIQIGSGGEPAYMITVDSLSLTGCDFIKIDVEGYEPLVLEGALSTIEKYRPVISYESNHKTCKESSISSHELLANLGYECDNVWGDNWIAVPTN